MIAKKGILAERWDLALFPPHTDLGLYPSLKHSLQLPTKSRIRAQTNPQTGPFVKANPQETLAPHLRREIVGSCRHFEPQSKTQAKIAKKANFSMGRVSSGEFVQMAVDKNSNSSPSLSAPPLLRRPLSR